MIFLILSILKGAVSSISDLISWIIDERIIDLGSKVQEAKSLEDEDKDDIKITQIRDESFYIFDKFSSIGRLPNDTEFRK
jgi:hypothetical protein